MTEVIEIEDDDVDLATAFDKAYKTKAGVEYKVSESHKFKDQGKYCLHQVYHPGTWLMDLVKFGDYWYVFFVEANTRYLIVVQGNSDFLTPDANVININRRVPSDVFLEAFERFDSMNHHRRIFMVIGDSEKAFWSETMIQYYERNNIRTKRINVSQDGHIGMSLLDRLVRTMRVICDNLYLSKVSVTPKEMIRAVVVYNNSAHHTFTKMGLTGRTPAELHKNGALEQAFRQALLEDNLKIRELKSYEIPPGTEVVVRDEMAKPRRLKKTAMVLNGKWYVEEYIPNEGYRIKNSEGEIIEKVCRRNLRPIYRR